MPYEINTLPLVGAGTGSPSYSRLQDGSSGNLATIIYPAFNSGAYQGLYTNSQGLLYNGSGFDIASNNIQGVIFSLAARTATLTSPVQTNYNARGALFFLNISAVAGTSPTLSFQVNTIDPVSGSLVAGTAVSTNIGAIGSWLYGAYPGMSSVFGGALASGSIVGMVGIPIPRVWNAQINIGGTTPSFTFSLGVMYIL